MPSQIGYFDTLKSVAGKVFTYLASITVTGTDGKTLTVDDDSKVDQDLSSAGSPTHANLTLTDGIVVDPLERIVDTASTEFVTVLTITSNNASWAPVLVDVMASYSGTSIAGKIQYSGKIANAATTQILSTTLTGTDMTSLFQWVLAANAGTMVLQAKSLEAGHVVRSRVMVQVRSRPAESLPVITW